jgi:hypothetical protein
MVFDKGYVHCPLCIGLILLSINSQCNVSFVGCLINYDLHVQTARFR